MVRRVAQLALLMALAPAPAPAEPWLVRPVAEGTNLNAAVAVAGNQIVALYGDELAVFDDPPDSPLVLNRIEGYSWIQHEFACTGRSPALALDEAANAYVTAFAAGSALFGQEVGMWGPMTMLPASPLIPGSGGAVLDVTVGPGGIPSVAGVGADGAAHIWSFSVPQGQWVSRYQVPGTVNAWSARSLCIDSEGQPALLCAVDNGLPADQPHPLLLVRSVGGQYVATQVAQAALTARISLASDGRGGLGFAFVDGGTLQYGSCRDWTVSTETLPAAKAAELRLTPRSLAFDAEGRPALVYGACEPEATGSQLHLLRKTGSTWTDEPLPMAAPNGSLSFDSAGQPVVAGWRPTCLELLGPALTPPLPGDANLDDRVDYLDLGALAASYRRTAAAIDWFNGDFNRDFTVDYLDLGVLAGNYRRTRGQGVPEPAAILLLSAAALLRRRTSRR